MEGLVLFLQGLRESALTSSSEGILLDIALIFVVSALFAMVAKLFKQPLIPAYVLAGLLIGPIVLGLISDPKLILSISKLEILFLIFIAGMEISFKKIKEAGLKRIIFIGVVQSLVVFGLTLLFSKSFSLSTVQAFLLGSALAFSSTLVTVRVLMERNELVTLHGRIALGVLLVQNLLAILAITLITSSEVSSSLIGYAFLKIAVLVALAILVHLGIGRVFRFTSTSPELLFVSTIALLFFFVIISFALDISIIVGAFLAGVVLANSPFKTDLESRMYPLGEFFSILFFVAMGTQITFTGLSEYMGIFLFILAVTLILKPFVLFLLSRISGYQASTSFQVSVSLGQLSELSIILGLLGLSAGIIDESLFSVLILSMVLTMSVTPYLIGRSSKLYSIFRIPARWFNFLPTREHLGYEGHDHKEILLMGSHRMGSILLKKLEEKRNKLLVVDFNPVIIHALMKKKIACRYGDVANPDLLSKVLTPSIKTVMSTVPGFAENMQVLTKAKAVNPKIIVIATAGRISDALKLYNSGADYVITPKILAGEQVLPIVHAKKAVLEEAKKKHLSIISHIHKILY